MFRYLPKKYHPDVERTGDAELFKKLVDAFEILRVPESRAEYDIAWEKNRKENVAIVEAAGSTHQDCHERAKILSIFYAQRRRNMREPGVSQGRVEDLTGCPEDLMNFHLWYFRQKGWIDRLESGQMAITAAGVDKIEERVIRIESAHAKIEHRGKFSAPSNVMSSITSPSSNSPT
jgi:curved DNA-binding protein CbpA